MRILKDMVGVVVSAAVTGFFFLGAPIIGLILTLIPQDLVDALATPDRPAVYFDGAYVLSPVEVEGELEVEVDGDLKPDEEPPEDPPDKNPEPEGSESGSKTEKENTTPKGAEVEAVATSKTGASAGTSRGGLLADRYGRPQQVRVSPSQKKSRKKCPKTFDGIKKRGDGTYEVNRKLVNYHTSSVKHFNELGWSKSNDKGDKKGWFISGFGCQDPLWHAGIRRGDIVLTVNGKKTNNMLQILMLYQKVKTKKRFEVVVRRKGKKITFNYEIVKG